jgi:hypothetical protein
MLGIKEIEGEPIAILGYRRAEDEPYRAGFHVLEIERSSGVHALVLTRAKVVNAQVEEFFADHPGEVCEEVTVVRATCKRNPERTYWTLDPAPADVGDPDDLGGDGDELPAVDEGDDADHLDSDERDRQADEADQELEEVCGGYTGLYLVFDVETTMDAQQNGRVLAWAVYGLTPWELGSAIWNGRTVDLDKCIERGLVYFPDPRFEGDIAACEDYADRRGMSCLSLDEFITEIFYPYVIGLGAIPVGFNIAFDLSRLAKRSGVTKRRHMYGAFSFKCCKCRGRTENCPQHPNIRILHVSNTVRFMDTAKPPFEGKEGYKRARILDVRTLAHALFDKKHNLESLSRELLRKGKTEDEDEKQKVLRGPINERYLDYVCGDVDITARCFQVLREIARGHNL